MDDTHRPADGMGRRLSSVRAATRLAEEDANIDPEMEKIVKDFQRQLPALAVGSLRLVVVLLGQH